VSLPRLPAKYDHPTFATPQRYIEAFKKRRAKSAKNLDFNVPENIILFFQPTAVPKINGNEPLEQKRFFHAKMDYFSNEVAVASQFGFGAPCMALLVELLIAEGAKRFVVVGAAGTLTENLNIGDFVLCDRALRDEGLSFHYAPPAEYAYPDSQLQAGLEKQFKKRGHQYAVGPTWTTDALYRETKQEIEAYKNQGVLTVDMEASALFTLARFHGVQAAAIFAVSDHLHGEEWHPSFHEIGGPLKSLLAVAFAALKN